MTLGENDAPGRATAATAADLLAHWWSRPVAAEVANWTAWHGVGAGVAATLAVLSTATPAAPSTDGEVQALLEEYERLFAGPGRVPCPPYESYWRDDVPLHLRRTLMGPCTEDLGRLYNRLGLRIASAAGELPDHVAVELEALAYALKASDTAPVAHALLADHLVVWLPTLCHAVARETTLQFYRDLAAVTSAWLAALQNLASPDAAD